MFWMNMLSSKIQWIYEKQSIEEGMLSSNFVVDGWGITSTAEGLLLSNCVVNDWEKFITENKLSSTVQWIYEKKSITDDMLSSQV